MRSENVNTRSVYPKLNFVSFSIGGLKQPHCRDTAIRNYEMVLFLLFLMRKFST